MASHVSRPYFGSDDYWMFSLKFCYNLFPKEYEFHKDDIVQLWLAESFTTRSDWLKFSSSNSRRWEIEEPASDLFESFLKDQFFQKSTARSRYTLNNSIFYALQEQINDTYFRSVDDDNSCISDNTLHCSLEGTFTLEELYVAESLQTLLILHTGTYLLNQVPRELFLKLPLLRALDLSYTSITELPSSIGNLKDLRYLNLSGTPITSLPDSLCYLSEMQTLKLKDCIKFLGLPEDTRKLTSLLHLDVDVACLLLWMPPSLGDLTALRKLPAFVVGKENGCRITELKDLELLSGELEILRLENVSSLVEAYEAGLHRKYFLNKLKLQWTKLRDGFTVLETLRPHENLKELDIVGYGGVKFPSWIGDPIFDCLTVLNIHDCARCKLIPPLGKLLSLRSLSISGMHSVKEITGGFCGREMVGGTLENFIREKVTHTSRSDNKFVAFPQLRSLILDRMSKLEKWSGVEESDFPSLQELTISGCPKLIALPTVSVMKTLRQLEISLCPLIESFPKGGMPTSLHCLVVVDCPLLKKQCLTINGRESGMLVHIDSVWIDYEQVPNLKFGQKQGPSQLSVEVMKSQTKAIDVSPCTPDVSREDMPDSSVETKYADSDVHNLNSVSGRPGQSQLSVDVMKSQTKSIDASPSTPDVSREDMSDSSVETKYADSDVHHLNSVSGRHQKIVIKVSMSDSKSRTKAMKLAVGVSGVTSACIQGDSSNLLVLTGERIDPMSLIKRIRKKVGSAELVSVKSIHNLKGKEEKEEGIVNPVCQDPSLQYVALDPSLRSGNSCTIM